MAALSPGDIICYRPNLVEVLGVGPEKIVIKGPYGEVQDIDWDDVREYNRKENYNWPDSREAWLQRLQLELLPKIWG